MKIEIAVDSLTNLENNFKRKMLLLPPSLSSALGMLHLSFPSEKNSICGEELAIYKHSLVERHEVRHRWAISAG